MRKLVLAVSIVAILTGAGGAAAHDTWVLPHRFEVQPGESVRVDMTSGMEFPKNDHAVSPDRLARHTVRLAGDTRPLAVEATEEHLLALTSRLTQAGIAALAVSSKPREIELTAEQAAEYLAEIGAGEEVREAWVELGKDRFQETYRKHATSFVRVGDFGDDPSWAEPQGLTLEIVPLSDPTRARAGTFPVRVLFEGEPLAGLQLGAICEGEVGEARASTDAEGRAELALTSGRCLIKGIHLRRSEGGPTDWTSDFATLSLRVP